MKRALLSVSDKTGIVSFAQGLLAQGYELISTGGTYQALVKANLPCMQVEDVTNFPEMMDGRVKTLHPFIHGGLLARRDTQAHMDAAKEHGIAMIDLVCVNLYPFKHTVENPNSSHETIIENIDIGGPSMLRSAAKNYASVFVVCDPTDYENVLEHMQASEEQQTAYRQHLAGKVYAHTAAYDAMIATYFNKVNEIAYPETLTLSFEKQQALRYGENPHQSAAFYTQGKADYSLHHATQLHGKELSYNNIQDANAAISLVKEFELPVYAALKHMNPCGIGWDQNPYVAWNKAYEADPVSIFGGLVATNQIVEADVALSMSQIFLEVVIAKGFSDDALAILTKKANIRLLTLDPSLPLQQGMELKSVGSDLLVQAFDYQSETQASLTCVTQKQATTEQLEHMVIAQRIVKYVKSNAIVLVNDGQCVGVGAGQMNRVGALALAIAQAKDKTQGAVLGSDAFFPMDDSVRLAASHGIAAIVQPGGSIKDGDSIAACDELGLTMYVTGVRHFKH
ncbi:MAG: bifunctional phosphoribosylaminoimidazolecarboxamide formyltransferase/IMP cyclohydrolase [Erysipelotrichaceae bacterium]